MPISSECLASDVRGAVRASLYLSAALYCEGSSSPAKIRNISATGALVESALAPAPGAMVQLIRGDLIVHGLVAWSADDRCGLKFSGSIDVQQWRAAPAHAEQKRVDDVVRLFKAGIVPMPPRSLALAGDGGAVAETGAHVSGDLRRVCDILRNLERVLAEDGETVMRHGPALQDLDIAVQVVTAVDAIIGGNGDIDVALARLAGLRRSADQALLRSA